MLSHRGPFGVKQNSSELLPEVLNFDELYIAARISWVVPSPYWIYHIMKQLPLMLNYKHTHISSQICTHISLFLCVMISARIPLKRVSTNYFNKFRQQPLFHRNIKKQHHQLFILLISLSPELLLSS